MRLSLKRDEVRVLLVCRSIAPDLTIAAVRWTKIAKYLKKNHKIYISLLTNQKDYEGKPYSVDTSKRDDLLENDIKYFDDYWTVPTPRLLKVIYSLMFLIKKMLGMNVCSHSSDVIIRNGDVSKPKRGLKVDLFEYRTHIEAFLWRNATLRFLRRKDLNDYDFIITSYGPKWVVLTGEALKKEYPGISWISDFRDPCATDAQSNAIYSLNKNFTMKHCKNADIITKVESFIQTFTLKEIPQITLTNGYDIEEALLPQKPQRFDLVFTGTLYPDWMDLSIVFKAIQELVCEGKMEKDKVKIVYAGYDGKVARAYAKAEQAGSYLEDIGAISRIDSMQLQSRAAILIQLGMNNEKTKSQWSGKVYEYMMIKKPIIYIVSGNISNSEPSKYIELLGGCCYEQSRDIETYYSLKKYIFDKYSEWKRTGNVTVERDENYVSKFSYSSIAEELWKIMKSIQGNK